MAASRRAVVALAACLLPAGLARAGDTGFLDRTLAVGGATRRYQVYLPADWAAKRSWPVILFLHGVGERGSDGLRQTQVGLGAAIRLRRERFPAVVVFPQCPDGLLWTSPGMTDEAMAALAAAVKEFRGDRKRLYLTGISMGAYGAWQAAALHPGVFAALTPVSGGVEAVPALSLPAVLAAKPGQDAYAALAAAVGGLPTWIFHGARDTVLPVEGSRKMAALLRAAHPSDRYTEYPDAGHVDWDLAYADPDWASWLFAQRLP